MNKIGKDIVPVYRGKACDGSGWVKGNLVDNPMGTFILPQNSDSGRTEVEFETVDISTNYMTYDLEPIFVNDIVSLHKGQPCRVANGNYTICAGHGDDLEEFLCTGLYLEHYDFVEDYSIQESFLEHGDRQDPISAFDIIGNMTDNPELIEVPENE